MNHIAEANKIIDHVEVAYETLANDSCAVFAALAQAHAQVSIAASLERLANVQEDLLASTERQTAALMDALARIEE